jgi:hypothetical protein
MKLIKKLLLVTVGLILVLAAIGMFLPSKYHVERSVTIRSSPDIIFPHLSKLNAWPEWTAWNTARYPDMKTTFTGPESGQGAQYYWEGSQVGKGSIKITSADPKRGIDYDLDFEGNPAKGGITMTQESDGVKVTWWNDGDLGMNPVGRYLGLMMDRFMGPDFETGLSNLKKRVEGG